MLKFALLIVTYQNRAQLDGMEAELARYTALTEENSVSASGDNDGVCVDGWF